MNLTKSIFDAIRSTSARFLKFRPQLSCWEEIREISARDKISHALRRPPSLLSGRPRTRMKKMKTSDAGMMGLGNQIEMENPTNYRTRGCGSDNNNDSSITSKNFTSYEEPEETDGRVGGLVGLQRTTSPSPIMATTFSYPSTMMFSSHQESPKKNKKKFVSNDCSLLSIGEQRHQQGLPSRVDTATAAAATRAFKDIGNVRTTTNEYVASTSKFTPRLQFPTYYCNVVDGTAPSSYTTGTASAARNLDPLLSRQEREANTAIAREERPQNLDNQSSPVAISNCLKGIEALRLNKHTPYPLPDQDGRNVQLLSPSHATKLVSKAREDDAFSRLLDSWISCSEM